ncbi:MAG: DUF4911 domain-containing protein [Proteobacteria bacterium]|nr:DUF4911 domain-containing protein [Pseudomonadota bacterium]
MKTINQFYRVNPADICFIRYVFEAHDGIAVITTLPTDKEIIAVRVSPGCEKEVEDVIDSLSNDVTMEITDLKADISL